MRRIQVIAVLLGFLSLTPARAEDIKLGWPLACAAGRDCWIFHHIDHDPTTAARDYTCGTLTYDGHDGTDIAVRDFKTMEKGVAVTAALDGKVVRVRNDIPDHHGTPEDLAAARASKKECGNRVSLLHADKVVTEYCHLKMGSVAVKLGDMVKKGQKLGDVGESGLAEFPHLHFSLRKNNAIVDPFTGAGQRTACGDKGAQLWQRPVHYEAPIIYATGFATAPPTLPSLALDASSPATITRAAPALVFWAEVWGLQAGDKLTLDITAPDGGSFAHRGMVAVKNKIRYLPFTGKKSQSVIQAGEYRGSVMLARDGSETRSKTASVRVK